MNNEDTSSKQVSTNEDLPWYDVNKKSNYKSETTIKERENAYETFYTAFEPKMSSRFICKLTSKEGNVIIPPYVIKECERPSITRKDDKWVWNPIKIRVYDPIVPSMAQEFVHYTFSDPMKFDVNIIVFGPVGDTVESWKLENAEFSDINFGTLDWCAFDGSGESILHTHNTVRQCKGALIMEIEATIKYEVGYLEY